MPILCSESLVPNDYALTEKLRHTILRRTTRSSCVYWMCRNLTQARQSRNCQRYFSNLLSRNPPVWEQPPPPGSNGASNNKKIYCSLGKSTFVFDPTIEYYVFRSYKLTPHHSTGLRRQYMIFGDYGKAKYRKRAEKIRSEGKMQFVMKDRLINLCRHLKKNCHTSEPFASQLCGSLNENATLPDSAYAQR